MQIFSFMSPEMFQTQITNTNIDSNEKRGRFLKEIPIMCERHRENVYEKRGKNLTYIKIIYGDANE